MKQDPQELFESSIVGVMVPIRMIADEAELVLKGVVEEQFDMNFADFNTLMPINMLGDCTQVEIARFNQVSEAAVSKRINNLVTSGLVERLADESDHRSSRLRLTAAGDKRMCSILLAITGRMETIFGRFETSKRDQVRELLLEMFPVIIEHSPRKDMIKKSQHPIITKLFSRSKK